MAQPQQILFPEGRLVLGNLYEPNEKDAEGRPLTIKNGPDAGKPRVQYFFGVAIPKTPGHTHWAQTEWGQLIWAVGHAAFPQAAQAPAFAWKVVDGDSTIPDTKGKRPSDNPNLRGHWVVKFSGGYAPKVFSQPSPGNYVEITTPGAVKPGYRVQVSGNVAGNESAQKPGVYLNYAAVLFVRPDVEIQQGIDPSKAFAGAAVSAALPGAPAVLPPGVTATHAAPLPPVPGVPGAPVALPPVPGVQPPPVAPPPVMVAPNPAITQLPPPPAAPAAVPMPPAEPQMTPAGAALGTYQSFRQANWSDAQLRQHGYIV